MTNTPDGRDFQSGLQRLEGLLRETERSADPVAQARVREVVQLLLDLHATGLERLLDCVVAADGAIIDTVANDDVVSGLLLLHGLHPLDLETRVVQALDHVRPRLRSHGGGVELLDVTDGRVRLRLVGNCDGCPSSALTMRQTIEEAILARAPDTTGIDVEEPAGFSSVEMNGHARFALPVV